MLRINELKLKIEEEETSLQTLICQKLKITKDALLDYRIIKRSIDARDNQQIYFIYTVDVKVKDEAKLLKKNKRLELSPDNRYPYPSYGDSPLIHQPVVIGFGPSGMFAALLLAEMGLKPLVFERGNAVEERMEDVKQFWENRKLNPNSNIQFGEGGAGTFSDGKLTTRVKDIRSRKVLEDFVAAGADEEILSVHNPHIGTDVLVHVVKNIREKIQSLGGEIFFDHRLESIEIKDNQVVSVTVNGKTIPTHDVILAVGHSARDTFEMLHEKGVELKQKALAIGLRIEHPQSLINLAQFGKKYQYHPRLGQAEYKLTYRASNERSVYTFCMCPGGTVVASSSELHSVVTNGMSEYLRDKDNANSALVCTVDEADFGSDHPLAGIQFQRELEQKAYELGGNDYSAPVQRVKDFLENRASTVLGNVNPSYPIGYRYANLNDLFSEPIQLALREAIVNMDHKLHGFALDDALLTGVETRTSSPLRILRDNETLQSVNTKGLYPTGEGAGYAGGIMSAAMDGLKVAEKIINYYRVERE
jgi:uncharacterized protein